MQYGVCKPLKCTDYMAASSSAGSADHAICFGALNASDLCIAMCTSRFGGAWLAQWPGASSFEAATSTPVSLAVPAAIVGPVFGVILAFWLCWKLEQEHSQEIGEGSAMVEIEAPLLVQRPGSPDQGCAKCPAGHELTSRDPMGRGEGVNDGDGGEEQKFCEQCEKIFFFVHATTCPQGHILVPVDCAMPTSMEACANCGDCNGPHLQCVACKFTCCESHWLPDDDTLAKSSPAPSDLATTSKKKHGWRQLALDIYRLLWRLTCVAIAFLGALGRSHAAELETWGWTRVLWCSDAAQCCSGDDSTVISTSFSTVMIALGVIIGVLPLCHALLGAMMKRSWEASWKLKTKDRAGQKTGGECSAW